MRVVKHIGARSTPAVDSKVLALIPYFPGEKIKSISIDAYLASGDASAIDQPSACNWYGLNVPWSLMFATGMLDGGGAPNALSTVAHYDTVFQQWTSSVTEGATEVFGGDVDSDPEIKTGEESHGSEELLDSGPIGVQKWFSREVIMRPMSAEGNTVIRFGDSFSAKTGSGGSHAMGGMLMFGVTRFDASAETNFNVELDDVTSLEMMGLLIAGDYSTVNAKIEGDTSALGDYLRTVLFGGDQYIEADTLKAAAAKATIKMVVAIETHLTRRR